MQRTLQETERHFPGLRRPFHHAAFAATTLNLGPATVCWPHRDSANAVGHLCLNGPNGLYNWVTGGHLVLHEAELVIQLRPGDLILFPSALVTHENIPIGEGETRFSITAYSAGGLQRFLAQGMRTQGEWAAVDPAGKQAHDEKDEARWEEAWRQFKTYRELRSWHGLPDEPVVA